MTHLSEKLAPGACKQRLKEGNTRFVEGVSEHPYSDAARLYQAGTEDQGDHAFATLLSCSDSRIPLERIFDAGIMDIFVIRVAGNVCQASEIASIEFGLVYVKTRLIVILGHTQCGAVTAAVNAATGAPMPEEENIPSLLEIILPAVNRAQAQHPDLDTAEIIPHATIENVWQSMENLFKASPVVRNLVKSGMVQVVGAIYDVGTGRVEWLPENVATDILQHVESQGQTT